MAGVTNRGKFLTLKSYIQGATAPATLYMALVTSAVAPTADTNILSDLTEIAAGNGYTAGGLAVARNATDWPTITEDDSADLAKIIAKNLVWTASGGNIPISGSGARYAVLLDDNITVGSRQVIAYFSLGSDRTVSDTQTLTLTGSELDLTE